MTKIESAYEIIKQEGKCFALNCSTCALFVDGVCSNLMKGNIKGKGYMLRKKKLAEKFVMKYYMDKILETK